MQLAPVTGPLASAPLARLPAPREESAPASVCPLLFQPLLMTRFLPPRGLTRQRRNGRGAFSSLGSLTVTRQGTRGGIRGEIRPQRFCDEPPEFGEVIQYRVTSQGCVLGPEGLGWPGRPAGGSWGFRASGSLTLG